jgi:hypothetical protein
MDVFWLRIMLMAITETMNWAIWLGYVTIAITSSIMIVLRNNVFQVFFQRRVEYGAYSLVAKLQLVELVSRVRFPLGTPVQN